MTYRPSDNRDGSGVHLPAALTITVLDGFDALSLSMVAPGMIEELGIRSSALAAVFASAQGGMILGAMAGGWLADRIGRLRMLLIALALFGIMALLMPQCSSLGPILVNRVIAGVGLGAAAPIAVALLGSTAQAAPSNLAVSLTWAGIGVGGLLAAAFNYLIVPQYGWQSIFISGGFLAIPAAFVAWQAFRRVDKGAEEIPRPTVDRARLRSGPIGLGYLLICAMFFFGYMTTSLIVSWLPTILSRQQGTVGMLSGTFAAVNVGGVAGALLLGWGADRVRNPGLLSVGWIAAGVCALAAGLLMRGNASIAVFSVLACTIATGAQSLSVALVNRMYAHTFRRTTTVGIAVGFGRGGQFSALAVSGLLLVQGISEKGLLAFGGMAAAVAGFFAFLTSRSGHTSAADRSICSGRSPPSGKCHLSK